jgi:MYXO-CTERM domain-containing protein
MSSGDGKNTNDKGESEVYFNVVTATDNGMQIKSQKTNIGPYQTHPGLCSGRFGTVGAGEEAPMHAALLQAPITGAGQPALQYVQYDAVSKNILVDTNYKYWTVGWYADAGYLANIYGQNPNDQGRDYLRCMGNIPNPAYGIDGGFKPTVKSFTAAPHSGRMYGEEPKNAMWLSLVPGETEKQVAPEAPDPPQKPPVNEEGGTTTPPPPGKTDPTAPSQPTLGNASSGCAMGSGAADLGTLLVLALGALGLARRRREV